MKMAQQFLPQSESKAEADPRCQADDENNNDVHVSSPVVTKVTKRKKRRKRTAREKGYRYRGRLKKPGCSEALHKRWADPVYREKMAQLSRERAAKRREAGLPGTRWEVPDGMLKKHATPLHQEAKESAARTMAKLEKAGVLDDADAQAREALQTTITIMRAPGEKKTQLAAARQVLEWTKAKPAAKQEVTINKAEEWLKQVAAHNDEGEASKDA